jgi:PhnB protein
MFAIARTKRDVAININQMACCLAAIHSFVNSLNKEFIMNVQAYLTFNGRCEEALEFYKKSVGAEVTGLMRWKENPDNDMKGPPGYEEKIMNAAFRIGETRLMADDGKGDKTEEFKGMTLAIEVADDAEAKRVFTALGEGGKVTMPLMKMFWSSSFGMLTDQFGVPWMVNVAAAKA